VLLGGGAHRLVTTSFIALMCLITARSTADQGISLEERLRLLAQAYPDAVAAIEGNELVLKSGVRLTIDDGQEKSHAEKLKSADIEDMLGQVYPIGRCDEGANPARNIDPGRIRNEEFFRQVYGNSRQAVERNLINLPWFNSKLRVTTVGGVDRALGAVAKDLAKLPAKYQRFFQTTAGTFKWRVIAGTKRLSVHSFGAAVDLNTKFADYWRWAGGKPGNVPRYKNKIPNAVVEVFERHGFVWGGKWYHFDTMHFEYRPELIAIARLSEARGCRG
jgi:D-alanyl-D-alanine carboxypeptidase